MTIYIGADHGGYHLKEEFKPWLRSMGHQIIDCGARREIPDDDYPDYAFAVADKVVADPGSMGILLCRSGAGVSIAANKVKGIRCTVGVNEHMVSASRKDDDINVLTLASDYSSVHAMKEMITAFLKTPFENIERRVRRLKKIEARET